MLSKLNNRDASWTAYLNGHGTTDLPAATGVVQSPDECPQELYTARE